MQFDCACLCSAESGESGDDSEDGENDGGGSTPLRYHHNDGSDGAPQSQEMTSLTAQHLTSVRLEHQYRTPDSKSGLRRCCPGLYHLTLPGILRHVFPLWDTVQQYHWKSDLFSDVVAGFTVGVMHLPQGLAYAMLANVPPVVGLYTSFFPVLVYFFMGTSRHISIGTFAVVCLMLSNPVSHFSKPKDSIAAEEITFSNITYEPVQVVTAIAFTVGIIQVLLAGLQLGVLSRFLSDVLISGFTTGAAVHVITSQIKHLFGLRLHHRTQKIGDILFVYYEIFSNIHRLNYVTLLLSIASIALLFLVSNFVNKRYKQKLKMPVPIELLVVILGTATSSLLNLEQNYGVRVVGPIPMELPPPSLPPFTLIPYVLTDSLIIAIVGYTVTLSMAMLFATKYKYNINANQELVAQGSANVIGSFFSCLPCAASMSRSLVQVNSGGKSQLASLASCTFILVVLLAIGGLFSSLPTCILASIVVVALQGMILQFKDLIRAYRFSWQEAAVWLVTFCAVVVLSVDLGLLVGVIVSAFMIISNTSKTQCCRLGNLPKTELYVDVLKYPTAEMEPRFVIVRFFSPLFYASKEGFRQCLYTFAGNPREMEQQRLKAVRMRNMSKLSSRKTSLADMCSIINSRVNGEAVERIADAETETVVTLEARLPIDAIVVDCSMWSYTDSAGIALLVELMDEYCAIGVNVYLASCQDPVVDILQKHPKYTKLLEQRIFPSISYALNYAKTVKVNP